MSANPISRRMAGKPVARRVWKPSGCLKIHLASVGVCALTLWLFSPATALIVSGVFVGIALLTLGIVEARRERLWLNPLSVFFFLFAVEMGPATIYAGVSLLTERSIDFPLMRIPVGDVALGYFISLIGTFTMHLGLRAFRPSVRRQPMARLTNWKPPVVVVLYSLGILAIYHPSWFLLLGIFGGMLQFGSMAVLLAFAFSGANVRSTLGMRLLFAAGVAIYVLAAFFSENSSKSYTMLAFLPAIVFVSRRRQYHKWVPVVGLALLVLYLGIVAPAVNTSRNFQQGDPYDKIMTGLRSSSPFYTDKAVITSMEDQFDALMGRVFEIPQVTGFMVGQVRRTGFQLGSTMTDLYYAFIPRIIWPEKPVVSRGAWFTTYLGMAPSEAEATTSTGMTTFGEWYWNFGIPGVIVGMFLTGALLSGLWRLAGSNPIHDPASMVLYVAVILNILNLPDATSPIVSDVALYLLFGGWIFYRRIVDLRAIRLRVSHQSQF